nr:16S rRNA (cytosine(967)-C(5))-methyltransferase RsmB [Oceanococcus sp. HetDA_MAG_MS8]
MAEGSAARRLAALALAEVRQGRALPEALKNARDKAPAISNADVAFARRMAAQVLQQRSLLDARVQPALQRPPKPAWVRELVLVGLVQLEDPDCPDHAAVAATVGAAPAKLRGLVNAILRKAGRGQLPAPDSGKPVDVQARQAGLPIWLYQRLSADWGEQLPAVIEGSRQTPPWGLRLNLQKTTQADYLQQWPEDLQAPRPLGAAGLVLPRPGELRQLPGFEQGWVSVQNPSAQQAATLLPLQPGMKVLDACAAPGGKTAHLLELEPQLNLTALDRDAQRLADVRRGLERLGLNARCVASDLLQFEESGWDAILLDVPCSATGILRRHPDIRWLRRSADIAALVKQQSALLEHAWSLLKPGGVLIYASCSILRAETVDVVQAFLRAHPQVQADSLQLPAGEWVAPGWRIRPGGDWDGFFYARLRQCAESSNPPTNGEVEAA